MEGILACWLPHTGFESAPDHIDAVLEGIVAEGLLRIRPLPDGKTLFYVRRATGPGGKPRRRRGKC